MPEYAIVIFRFQNANTVVRELIHRSHLADALIKQLSYQTKQYHFCRLLQQAIQYRSLHETPLAFHRKLS